MMVRSLHMIATHKNEFKSKPILDNAYSKVARRESFGVLLLEWERVEREKAESRNGSE